MFNPLQSIKSHLSWRLLSLFFAAAIIPVLALGITSYLQISTELTRQSQHQNRLLAKTTGMDIYEKLRYLSSQFKLVVDNHEQSTKQQLDEFLLASSLKSLFIVDRQLQIQLLAGQQYRPSGKLLQLAETATHDYKVAVFSEGLSTDNLYIFSRIDEQHFAGSEISKEELWNVDYLNTLREDVCIMSPQRQPLFCNFTPDESWLAAVAKDLAVHDAGYFEWHGSDSSRLTTYWSIFFAPHFNFPKWTVVISITPTMALAPVKTFQTIFPRILLLTVVLALLLTTLSIRRNLLPLKHLLSATQKIAEGDFSQRVQLQHCSDEFSLLGKAFNRMASRLDTQFTHLNILSQLDSSFHETNSLDGIVRAVWAALSDLQNIKPLGICCIDSNENNCLNWEFQIRNNRMQAVMTAEKLISQDQLPQKPQHATFVSLLQEYPCLTSLEIESDTQVMLLPALRDTSVIALLLLEHSDDNVLTHETRQLLQQIIDLIAIKLDAFFLGQNLHYLAHHDVLTGLPNRAMITHAIQTSLINAREGSLGGAVILIDLDKFKTVNDTQGHAAGDELLIQVARRFKKAMRPKDTVSRLSGDEFVVVLVNLEDEQCHEIATRTVNRLMYALAEPFTIDGTQYNISASMGIAIYPRDGNTPAEILQAADAAMYSVKSRGSGHYSYYSAELHQSMLEHLEVERSILPAIKNDEFMLCYQPVIDQTSNRVLSAEALVRWIHPERGLLAPGMFIEIAEKSTLIEDLGEWVLRRACMDFKNWLDQGVNLSYLSVNVSTRQLDNTHFVETVRLILEEAKLDAVYLVLEITETALIDSYKGGQGVLDDLSEMGVRISIDDFGTGYASLSYLKSLPADFIKIDRSFIRELPDNSYDSAIINVLSGLASALELSLIAEGVENREQAEYLRNHGINNVQGFYYSKPLDEAAFLEYYRTAGN